MKRIILSILAICVMSALANAESCTSVGATDKKYTPSGCDYKTETRTCCEDCNWSDWDKTCKPKYKECEEGDEGTATVELWGSSAYWSGKVVGSKTCQRKCVNGKWEYALKGISCSNGWAEFAGGADGKVCKIGRVVQTARIKGKPNTYKTPEGQKGLPARYQYNQKCDEAEHGYWRKEGEDEANGVTNYLQCQFHGYWNSLMGKPYSIHRVSIDYVHTYPDGCDGNSDNLKEERGAWCTNIGACRMMVSYTDKSATYDQCIEEDDTSYDEVDCASADY